MAKMEALKRKRHRASETASAQGLLNEIPVEGRHEEEVKMGDRTNRKGNVRRKMRSSVQRSSLERSTRACRTPSSSSSSSDSSSLSPSSQSLPLLSRKTRRYPFFSGSFKRRRLRQLTGGLIYQRLSRGNGRNGGKSAASVETPGPLARGPSSARQGPGAPSAMLRVAAPFLRVQRAGYEMPATTGAEQRSKPPQEPSAELATLLREAEVKVKDACRGEENEVAKKARAKGRKPPAERREVEANRREGESAGEQPEQKSEEIAAVGAQRDEATQHERKTEKRGNRREVLQCQLRHVELLKQRHSGAKHLESCDEPGVSLPPLHAPTADSTPRRESADAERQGENGDNGDSVQSWGVDLGEEVDATPDKERSGEKNAALTLPLTARHCRAPEAAAYTARIGDLEMLLSRQGASHSRLALRCLDTARVDRVFEKRVGEAQTSSSRGTLPRAEATLRSPAAIEEERRKLFSRYRAELRRFWVAREQDVFRFLRQCCTVQGVDRLALSSSSSPSSPSCCLSAVSAGVSAGDGAAFGATHSPAERAFVSEAPGRSSDTDETGRGRAPVEGQCQWSRSPEFGGEDKTERARVDVCGDGGDASQEEDAQVEAASAKREDDGGCLRKLGTRGAPQPAQAASLTNRRRVAFYRDLLQTNLHVAAQAADVSETAACAAALLRQVPVRMRSWRREVHMHASGCEPARAGHKPSRLGSEGCAQKRHERQGEAAGTAISEDTTAGRREEPNKVGHGKYIEGACKGPRSRLKPSRGRGSVAESGCAGDSLGDGGGLLRWKEESEQVDEEDLSADESRRRLALLEAACCRLFLVCVRGATKPLVSSHPSFGGSPAIRTNTAILECLSVVLQLLEHFGDPGDAPSVQAKNGENATTCREQDSRLSRVGDPKFWCAWLLHYSAEGKEKDEEDWRNLRERPLPLFSVVKVVKEVCRELRLGNWARVFKVYVHLKSLAVAWLVRGHGPRSGSECMRVSSACKSCVATNAGKEIGDEKEANDQHGNTRYWSAVPAEFCSGASAELLLTTLFLLEVFVSDLRVAAAEVVFNVASRQSGLEEKELRLKELLRHFPVGPAGAALAVETSRHANAYPEKEHGRASKCARIQRNDITSPFSSSFFSPLDEFASALPPSLQRLLQSDSWRKDAKADTEAAVLAALEEGFSKPSSATKTPRKASNASARLRQLRSLEDLDLRATSKKKSNQRA
ncbi:UNVERIFIED_CONTAM: hypothetical protein HHA_289110 [Hammondia hammondi]|eukprot:XP_008889092.1 hypothetical protein HHA_289110 [Hammondia hammondi]